MRLAAAQAPQQSIHSVVQRMFDDSWRLFHHDIQRLQTVIYSTKSTTKTQPSSTMISMAAKPSSKPSFSCFLAAFCSRDLPVALRLLACEASGLHRRRSGFAGHQLRFGCASLGSCFLTFLTYFGSKSHHSSGQDQVESRGRSRNRTLFAVQCQCHGHDDSTHGIFQYWSWCLNMRIHIMYIHVNIYIYSYACMYRCKTYAYTV